MINKDLQVEESLLPINHHAVSLPMFEGPLDLLLFLIRKNEIDIYDIPIANVTKQYLNILTTLDNKDLDLTGEFFVMAATLMLIKSRMLLPKNTPQNEEELEEEAEEDPRWELVQQLIEYKKIKEQAEGLEKLIAKANDLLPREFKEDLQQKTVKRPLKSSDKMELWNAFNKVLHKLAEKMIVGEIYDEKVTVADQMNLVLKTIQTRPRFLFSSLFKDDKITVNLLISSFLAILELTRLDKLCLEQTGNFSDILCISKEFINKHI